MIQLQFSPLKNANSGTRLSPAESYTDIHAVGLGLVSFLLFDVCGNGEVAAVQRRH